MAPGNHRGSRARGRAELESWLCKALPCPSRPLARKRGTVGNSIAAIGAQGVPPARDREHRRPSHQWEANAGLGLGVSRHRDGRPIGEPPKDRLASEPEPSIRPSSVPASRRPVATPAPARPLQPGKSPARAPLRFGSVSPCDHGPPGRRLGASFGASPRRPNCAAPLPAARSPRPLRDGRPWRPIGRERCGAFGAGRASRRTFCRPAGGLRRDGLACANGVGKVGRVGDASGGEGEGGNRLRRAWV